MDSIAFHCRKCKKSFRVSYMLTGLDETPVIMNVCMKCNTCRRTAIIKKYTEKILKQGIKDNENKFYV